MTRVDPSEDLLTMASEGEDVLKRCKDLLEDIKQSKGVLSSVMPTNVQGNEIPADLGQNKGDDIWMFYKSVQTEVSAIAKVLHSKEYQINERRYKTEN